LLKKEYAMKTKFAMHLLAGELAGFHHPLELLLDDKAAVLIQPARGRIVFGNVQRDCASQWSHAMCQGPTRNAI